MLHTVCTYNILTINDWHSLFPQAGFKRLFVSIKLLSLLSSASLSFNFSKASSTDSCEQLWYFLHLHSETKIFMFQFFRFFDVFCSKSFPQIISLALLQSLWLGRKAIIYTSVIDTIATHASRTCFALFMFHIEFSCDMPTWVFAQNSSVTFALSQIIIGP